MIAGLVFLFALASVLCFFAAGGGWSRGVAFGWGCAAVVALLIPAIQGLPGL